MIALKLKEFLNLYVNRTRSLENDRLRLYELKLRSRSPVTTQITGLPHSLGFDGNRITRNLSHIEELEEEIKKEETQLLEIHKKLKIIIYRLNGRNLQKRDVLTMRYLDCFDWKTIVEIMFGSEADFEERDDVYLNRAQKIHGAALKALAELLTLEEMEEIFNERRTERRS